jgi:uncharacterized membrane protein YhaH (DUF805 family)
MAFSSMSNNGSGSRPVPVHGVDSENTEGIGAALWAGLFSFKGTATRMLFWIVILSTGVIATTIDLALITAAGVKISGGPYPLPLLLVMLLVDLVSAWIGFSVTTRRLRDRAWSNGGIVTVLVALPILGFIAPFLVIVVPVGVVFLLWAGMGLLNLWILIECGFLPSKE